MNEIYRTGEGDINHTQPQKAYNVNSYRPKDAGVSEPKAVDSPQPTPQQPQSQQAEPIESGRDIYSGYGYNYNQVSGEKVSAAPQGQREQAPKNTQPPKPKKQTKSGTIVAVAIVCALAGGLVGGGAAYYLAASQLGNSATQKISIDGSYKSNVEAVAAKVLPSVVGIQISRTSVNNYPWFGSQNSSSSSVEEGSGVIYKSDGYIITNYHVISSAISNSNVSVNVYLNENTEKAYPAKIIGYDASADLAVIKIDAANLTPVEIANSDEIKVGETAITVGNPGGMNFAGSVSQGIISGLNRSVTLESGVQMKLLQTDAAINPGNSGGALVNGSGQLIGISSAKLASTSFEGMGFAIPVNDAVSIVDQLISNQGKTAPYLGITMDTRYTADLLKQYGMPGGVVVASVSDNSPAASAGLKQGDIITKANDTATPSADVLKSVIANANVGDSLKLEVYRNGQTGTINATLGEAPSQAS